MQARPGPGGRHWHGPGPPPQLARRLQAARCELQVPFTGVPRVGSHRQLTRTRSLLSTELPLEYDTSGDGPGPVAPRPTGMHATQLRHPRSQLNRRSTSELPVYVCVCVCWGRCPESGTAVADHQMRKCPDHTHCQWQPECADAKCSERKVARLFHSVSQPPMRATRLAPLLRERSP
jgi:hypothetical protein